METRARARARALTMRTRLCKLGAGARIGVASRRARDVGVASRVRAGGRARGRRAGASRARERRATSTSRRASTSTREDRIGAAADSTPRRRSGGGRDRAREIAAAYEECVERTVERMSMYY